MDWMHVHTAVIFACIALFSTTDAILVAKYNMGGVTGTIRFSPNSQNGAVDIVLNLTGLPGGFYYQLELHEYRVNYDTADRCSVASIGNRLGDPVLGITSGSGSLQAAGFALSGPTSIEGRSFLLTNRETLTICATVESDEDYITAFAHLPSFIGGTMLFRQRASDSSADTTIQYELFHTSQNRPVGALKWQINSGVVAMDINAHTSIEHRCGTSVGGIYNPTSSSGSGCATNNHVACSIGDLSGKHGDVTMNASGKTRGFFPDLNLPLSGVNSIIGKTIVFVTGDSNYACANIVEYPTVSAVSKFSNERVKGHISFTQKSPYDVTTVQVDLQNLDSRGGGYHVHKWPVPKKIEQSDMLCGPDDVSGHWNPFNAPYPLAAGGTPDQYEIGDISGKFRMLTGMSSINETYYDPNLPLFGVNSIVGRSLVIHKDLTGAPRWICATIQPMGSVITAVATFTYPVIGYMIMRQASRESETQIYAELNYASGALTQTMGHDWHIHQLQVGDDMMAPTGRCLSVAGHYNPYDVFLNGDYSTECKPTNPLRCELGDLVGKHGQLNIRTINNGSQKYFFTDMQLPLSGPQSVVGKSIVIHDANSGSGRLSCANIYAKPMRKASVTSWTSADTTAGVSGYVKFDADSTEILSGLTHISVELAGLNNLAGGYHVHVFPTGGAEVPQADRCKDGDVGGHLNPFGAAYPLPVGSTNDVYEIGDLSGKCGLLSGGGYKADFEDNNLPMEGPHSIVGRSVVIHKDDASASRWVCGTIEEATPGATKIMSIATFDGTRTGISGTIHMTQYRYSNGDMSDTTFLVNVRYDNGTNTTGHDWHVHQNPITAGDCMSAGGHYNPFMVDLSDKPRYLRECSMSNPLRCEVGDQSGKMGQYSIGMGKRFYTDVNVNLEGKYAAAKRSIVFHAQNGGGPRIACADILPYDRPDNTMYILTFLSVDYIRSEVEGKVADSINAHAYNIQAEPYSSDNIKCKAVKLYFLGPEAAQLRASFVDVINGKIFAKLKPFVPTNECVSGGAGLPQLSLLVLLIGTLLSRLFKS